MHAAEQLFSTHGYAAVSLRQIAQALQLTKSSLYNHAPGGKQELFLAVMERSLVRHRLGLEQATHTAPPELRAQLQAMAHWLLSQPPLNMQRMQVSDLPALAPGEAERVMQLVYQSLFGPIERVVQAAALRGEAIGGHAGMLAGTFLVSVEAFRELTVRYGMPMEVMVNNLITLLIKGVEPR